MEKADELEPRIARLQTLLDPVIREAYAEKREEEETWHEETVALVAAALRCSPQELRAIQGWRKLKPISGWENQLSAQELADYMHEGYEYSIGLPMKLDRSAVGSSRCQLLVITRRRWPEAAQLTWNLERRWKDIIDAGARPRLVRRWGWWYSQLTRQAIAKGAAPGPCDPHYRIENGRVDWTDDAFLTGVLSPSDRASDAVHDIRDLILKSQPRYRIEVRDEVYWTKDDKKVRAWIYRILDPLGRIVESSVPEVGPLDRPEHEYGLTTRTAAIEAAKERLTYLSGRWWQQVNV